MPSTDAARSVPKADVLGVAVSAINMDDAIETIDGWVATGARHYVTITGVHGVMESHRDESLRRIHNAAGLVTPDGMPLVWLSRWQGFGRTTRVYGPDLMLALCRRSLATGYRHFFYGGHDGVPEQLAQRLVQQFPGLVVAGTYSPPFRSMSADERTEIVRQINDTRPDIVWVGLGTPKQERWMAEHVDRLNAAALIGVGAAFDFHAGLKRQAPRWMQRSGLEWLFRLATEPRRLWRRYLVNNPQFIWLSLGQMLRTAAGSSRRADITPAGDGRSQPERDVV